MAAASEGSLLQQALALHREGKLAAAQRRYQDVVKINPRNYDARRLLGVIEYQRGNHRMARATLNEAIAIAPQVADAHYFLGRCLADMGETAEAVSAYEACLRCEPHHENAAISLGIALAALDRTDAALARFDAVLAANPRQSDALFNRAGLLRRLSRYDEALADFDRVIALDPGFLRAWLGRGELLFAAGRYVPACADFEQCLRLDPASFDARASLAQARPYLADWRDAASGADLLDEMRRRKQGLPLPVLLSLGATPPQLLTGARHQLAHLAPDRQAAWDGPSRPHERIRIAYLSSDFRAHATSYLIAGLFECHDASRFDIFAVALGPRDNSEIRRRVQASIPHFLEASALSDADIAARLREWEIDIAVDLNALALGGRLGILARRPAPIQVSYLGFPGTTGADFFDYIVADRIVIPEDHRQFYAEKVVWLPDSYQVNDSKRPIAASTVSRADAGLPPHGFVFCCFNNTFKIGPDTFDSWMRILGCGAGSVLWLFEDNAIASANLKKEAAARGVDPERLIFAKRMDLPDHLARHRLADLFLDTLPYNAHTTASDALWAGLPVLTLLGPTFAGRVAASLLNAVGLPELITTTAQAFEDMAVDLASHPEKLAALKSKLATQRATAALFDTPRFTKDIETAYVRMQERRQAGLPPDHIAVAHEV